MLLFEEHFSSACLFVMDFLKVFWQKLNELSNKKSKAISNLFWMLSTEINACLLGYFSIVVIFFSFSKVLSVKRLYVGNFLY